jgi:hypothetical protein
MKWLILLLLIPLFAFGQSYELRSPAPYPDNINLGEYPFVSTLNKFAYRDGIQAADGDALVWPDGAINTPTILTSASTFTVTYNNATDGLGTTGALSLLFTYIDENEEETTGVLTLGSSGSDVTSFSGLGINRVVVLSSGSAGFNTNDITITATTGGSTQAFLDAGTSVTQQLIAHIPANTTGIGKFLFVNALRLSGGSAPRVVFKVKVYSRITQTTYEVFRYEMDTGVQNSLALIDPIGFNFSPRNVIYITANTDTNNTDVSARISIHRYENP